jgi:Tfp pilus assembly protein PilZ
LIPVFWESSWLAILEELLESWDETQLVGRRAWQAGFSTSSRKAGIKLRLSGGTPDKLGLKTNCQEGGPDKLGSNPAC